MVECRAPPDEPPPRGIPQVHLPLTTIRFTPSLAWQGPKRWAAAVRPSLAFGAAAAHVLVGEATSRITPRQVSAVPHSQAISVAWKTRRRHGAGTGPTSAGRITLSACWRSIGGGASRRPRPAFCRKAARPRRTVKPTPSARPRMRRPRLSGVEAQHGEQGDPGERSFHSNRAMSGRAFYLSWQIFQTPSGEFEALRPVDWTAEGGYHWWITSMDIHLSEEAARYIEAQLNRSGCSSPSEFIEHLLRELRCREAPALAEKQAWLRAQEEVAARIWDNEADARYDAL